MTITLRSPGSVFFTARVNEWGNIEVTVPLEDTVLTPEEWNSVIFQISSELQLAKIEKKLCWSGPCYSHGPHTWTESAAEGGRTYRCSGASTDRT